MHMKIGCKALIAPLAAAALLASTSIWAAETTARTTTLKAGTPTLGLAELEQRISSQGLRVKEMKIKDLLLEVEAYDEQNREVELLIDRRSGEVLSREFDR